MVTLTYWSKSQRQIMEKNCHEDISTPAICIVSILLLVSDPSDETIKKVVTLT